MNNPNKFRIGDHVKIGVEANNSFEIIATQSQPHVAIDKTVIGVPEGFEYVLRILDQQKAFEPYRYANGRNLRLV